jgi:hypothetical protein
METDEVENSLAMAAATAERLCCLMALAIEEGNTGRASELKKEIVESVKKAGRLKLRCD